VRKQALLLAALLASAAALHATELKLAAVFTDHAVLQREAAVPVWGWADAGAEVKVEFAGQTKTAKADATGKWMVKLDPLKTSAEPQKLTVTAGKSSVVFNDILVGEVWLGSGQSNMALQVGKAKDFEQEKAAANLPLVRMFLKESPTADAAQADGKGSWKVCAPGTVGEFSATLFFFGREIHKTIGVPVGLINASVGGTPIELWISPEAQHASATLKPFFAALNDEKKKEEAALVEAKRALANWEAAAKKAKAEGQPAPRKPRNPRATAASRGDPGRLFNGKIAPLIPYAIRGAIWYQGESNTQQPIAPFYKDQLPLLVKDWRARWGYEFPFAWAQLPNYACESDRDWPTVREAELQALALPKTGMGINIDLGEEKNIHPKNKQEVGRRLSLWALGTVYGQKVPATSGPLPAGSKVTGGEVELSFTHTDGGLVAKDGDLKGFVVAGADKAWKPATARIAGEKVIVSSAEVKSPVAVRYAWENWPTCNLYNGAGLPASPFRTDDWK